MIRKLTSFLNWVSSFEEFLIRDISFNKFSLIASILLGITIYITWNKFKAKNIIFLLITLIGFQSSLVFSNWKEENNSLVIFHKTKQTLIGFKNQQ